MKRSMCIAYKVDSSIYVNMTNRCSNSCEFCIRNNGDGAYGSDSLWLEREPTREEILSAVFSSELDDAPELVFCGYGEPTYRLCDAVFVAERVKERFPDIKIRINTNGQSDLINKRETAKDFSVFDTVSISLNTPSSERYKQICRPIFKDRAFESILSFASAVKEYAKETVFSLVREFLTEEEIEECKRIAEKTGVRLRIRDYIPPECQEDTQ